MPFAFFQKLKAFVASLVVADDKPENKIITVDVEAGLWNGLCVEDLSPKVTVHGPEGFEVKVK